MINLTPEQQKMLADIPDRMFRQTTRDFCVNQSFRKDYWVKGARQLTWLEQVERLRIQRVVLVRPRAEVVLKVIGNAGGATLQESLYGPVLDLLADHKPKTLAFLEQQLEAQNMVFAQILEVVMVLMGMGVLAPAQDETVVAKVKKHTDRLNTYLMSKVRSNNDLKFLVSPVTGAAFWWSALNSCSCAPSSRGIKRRLSGPSSSGACWTCKASAWAKMARASTVKKSQSRSCWIRPNCLLRKACQC